VFLVEDEVARIMDFGIAFCVASGGTSKTVVGTVGYMSPEQVRAQPVDARSDLFALGVVLYEMATGRAPFRRPTFADTQSAILNEQPELATNLNPEVPAGLAQLIDKLLAKNPEDRYPSADAVVEDLNALRAPRTAAPPTLSMRILRIVAVLTLLALLILWLPQLGRGDAPGPVGRQGAPPGSRKGPGREQAGAGGASRAAEDQSRSGIGEVA
jgi:serine/threonine protein kinase